MDTVSGRVETSVMEIYGWLQGALKKKESLWDTLQIPDEFPMVLSLVGAGGKTHVMYRLADEMAARGYRVIATTSTHICEPAGLPVCLADSSGEVCGRVRPGSVLVVGREMEPDATTGTAVKGYSMMRPEEPRKLRGLPEDEIGKLAACADVILIEADGAKRLPLKAPAAHEPVIIPETRVVIGCCGLDSIGRTLRECCFRPEIAASLLRAGSGASVYDDRTGSENGMTEGNEYPDHHVVVPQDLVKLLSAHDGTRKHVGDRLYRVVLNKADGEREKAAAVQVIRDFPDAGKPAPDRAAVVFAVTSFGEQER